MKLKSTYTLLTLAFLFIFTANANLEARHSRHTSRVEVINHTYYPTQYVVQEYHPQPVYVREATPIYVTQPVQTVVLRQDPVIYRERVVVRERSSASSLITSFALGLGFGLLR